MEKTIFEQITLFNKIRENDGDHYYNMSKSDIVGIIKFLRGEVEDSFGKFKMIMNDCYPEKDLEFFEYHSSVKLLINLSSYFIVSAIFSSFLYFTKIGQFCLSGDDI